MTNTDKYMTNTDKSMTNTPKSKENLKKCHFLSKTQRNTHFMYAGIWAYTTAPFGVYNVCTSVYTRMRILYASVLNNPNLYTHIMRSNLFATALCVVQSLYLSSNNTAVRKLQTHGQPVTFAMNRVDHFLTNPVNVS